MTELESIRALERYDKLKKARRRRKTWIKVISMFAGLLLGWITACIVVKTFSTKKLMSYCFTEYKPDYKKTQEENNLPADWTTWYKDLKDNFAFKKLGKEETHFTKEKIMEREVAEKGKKLGGKIGEEIGKYLGSNYSGLSDEEKKQVDYNAYAGEVYRKTFVGWMLSAVIFWLVFWLILRYLILPLSWKEPLITEQNPDKV